MMRIGFHLGCEKTEGRRTMAVTNGLKDCSLATGAAGEPRSWPAAVISPDGDDGGFFFLICGLPMCPEL
jgi:hypothetical protein